MEIGPALTLRIADQKWATGFGSERSASIVIGVHGSTGQASVVLYQILAGGDGSNTIHPTRLPNKPERISYTILVLLSPRGSCPNRVGS
jgi:hypothetical protein